MSSKSLQLLPPIFEFPLLGDEAFNSPRSQDSDFLHFLVDLDVGAQELAPTGSANTLHVNKERSESPGLFATGFSQPNPALSRAGSYLSGQQQTSLVPTPGLAFIAGAQPSAVWQAPGLVFQGGHGEGGRGGVQGPGHCTAPPIHSLASQVSGLPLQLEKAFPSAATTCGPLISGSDTSNAGIVNNSTRSCSTTGVTYASLFRSRLTNVLVRNKIAVHFRELDVVSTLVRLV